MPLYVLVYSDNARTRAQVMLALGKRVHPKLPDLTYTEVATAPVVIKTVDAGGIDLAILMARPPRPAEMGIAKQLKDEVNDCPPIVELTGRPTMRGSPTGRAEAAVPHPLDPIRLADAVVDVLLGQQ